MEDFTIGRTQFSPKHFDDVLISNKTGFILVPWKYLKSALKIKFYHKSNKAFRNTQTQLVHDLRVNKSEKESVRLDIGIHNNQSIHKSGISYKVHDLSDGLTLYEMKADNIEGAHAIFEIVERYTK